MRFFLRGDSGRRVKEEHTRVLELLAYLALLALWHQPQSYPTLDLEIKHDHPRTSFGYAKYLDSGWAGMAAIDGLLGLFYRLDLGCLNSQIRGWQGDEMDAIEITLIGFTRHNRPEQELADRSRCRCVWLPG